MGTVRSLLLGYLLVALLAGWPIASVALAGVVASANGCTLHEGVVNPCLVHGRDVGRPLYGMFVAGWFMLLTIPLGVLSSLLWTLVWMILRIKGKRARAPG